MVANSPLALQKGFVAGSVVNITNSAYYNHPRMSSGRMYWTTNEREFLLFLAKRFITGHQGIPSPKKDGKSGNSQKKIGVQSQRHCTNFNANTVKNVVKAVFDPVDLTVLN